MAAHLISQPHVDGVKALGIIDAVLTYDEQLQAGCGDHDLAVEAPVLS